MVQAIVQFLNKNIYSYVCCAELVYLFSARGFRDLFILYSQLLSDELVIVQLLELSFFDCLSEYD
jgi:hypothetical protein